MDFDTGPLQVLAIAAPQLHSSESVHQQPHLHSGPGALLESFDELLTDFIGLEDVRLEIHRVPGIPDCLQHRRVETVTILEQRGLAPAKHWIV